MVMKRNTRRTWFLGAVAVVSLLGLGACADDVGGADDEIFESDALQQVSDGGSLVDGGAPHDAGVAGDAAVGLDASVSRDAGPAKDAAVVREDLGKGDGKDVITIGDSWMQMIGTSSGLEAALDRLGLKYAHYAVLGTQMTTGAIPNQFANASRRNKNIKTVIMTGGGNDILITGAPCSAPGCPRLKEITKSLVDLWNKMGAAGVKDVVYVGYSEGAGSSPAAVTNVMKNGVGDACLAMTSLRCHPIDSTPIVGRRLVDGIHPSNAALNDLAKVVVKLMEDRGIRR